MYELKCEVCGRVVGKATVPDGNIRCLEHPKEAETAATTVEDRLSSLEAKLSDVPEGKTVLEATKTVASNTLIPYEVAGTK